MWRLAGGFRTHAAILVILAERMAAATSYLADEAGGRERLSQIVARARNFRPAIRRYGQRPGLARVRGIPGRTVCGLTGYRRGRGSLLPVGRSSHETPRDP